MSRFEWLSEYLARLEDEHVLMRSGSAVRLAPAHCLDLDAEDWGRAVDRTIQCLADPATELVDGFVDQPEVLVP